MSKIAVITPYTNTQQYKVRKKLYLQFAQYIKQCGLDLFTVELAINDQPFEVTENNNPFHLQIRGNQEFWFKENLQQIMIDRLPKRYDTVLLIDGDCMFTNPNWIQDTLNQLEQTPVIQLWSQYVNLGPDLHQLDKPTYSFTYTYNHSINTGKNKIYGAPGLAWGWKRSILDKIGMMECCIVGGGDTRMVHGMINDLQTTLSIDENITSYTAVNGHHRSMLKWAENAYDVLDGNIGYINNLAIHYFHGSKKNRAYTKRHEILVEHKYDPELDLVKDSQGLLILNPNKTEMIKDISEYFKSRNEDSTEV